MVWVPVVWDSNRDTPFITIPFMFVDPIRIQTTGPQTTNLHHSIDFPESIGKYHFCYVTGLQVLGASS